MSYLYYNYALLFIYLFLIKLGLCFFSFLFLMKKKLGLCSYFVIEYEISSLHLWYDTAIKVAGAGGIQSQVLDNLIFLICLIYR